jgi:tol-pal system-associated acyl-CoA thioesterase
MEEYILETKVYLEDTDAQGIVYHANYMKYIERGRSECLDAKGYRLSENQGKNQRFVVHEAHLKYKQPAQLGDVLEIVTTYRKESAYRVVFDQVVRRKSETNMLLNAKVHVVCIGQDGNLMELPADLF